MGAVNVPAQFHACAGPEKSLERSVLAHPKLPVREMVGKKRALAAPMRAFAAISSCSAWRMSGRRSRRSEGSPSGIDGRVRSSMVFPRGMGPGFLPRRTEMPFSCWETCFWIRGILASACSYSDLTWESSSSEITPPSKRRVKSLYDASRLLAVLYGNHELLIQIAEVHVGIGHGGN